MNTVTFNEFKSKKCYRKFCNQKDTNHKTKSFLFLPKKFRLAST